MGTDPYLCDTINILQQIASESIIEIGHRVIDQDIADAITLNNGFRDLPKQPSLRVKVAHKSGLSLELNSHLFQRIRKLSQREITVVGYQDGIRVAETTKALDIDTRFNADQHTGFQLHGVAHGKVRGFMPGNAETVSGSVQ